MRRGGRELAVASVRLVVLATAALMGRAALAQEVDGGPPLDAALATPVGAAAPAPASAATPAAVESRASPPPDQASGILLPPAARGSALLWVPRIVLFVPRWLLEVPMAPLRLGAYAIDRYQ